MAKVSIIVPVHNTEPYLRTCVSSIQKQTLKDIEIILVENASTDGSLALCRQLEREDERIRCISIEVGDLQAARNAGARAATSEFLGFVDSDDEIEPKMYEHMYSEALKNDADVVTCNFVKVYPMRPPKHKHCEDGKVLVLTPKEMVFKNFDEKISVSQCVMMVSRKIYLDAKLQEKVLYEDRASTFLLCAAARRCVQINKAYYKYHQYRGTIIKAPRTFMRSWWCARADLIRLRYIKESGMFTPKEGVRAASESADSLLRKINRMRKDVLDDNQRQMMREAMQGAVELIPNGCPMSLKAKIILFFVKRSIASSPTSGK